MYMNDGRPIESRLNQWSMIICFYSRLAVAFYVAIVISLPANVFIHFVPDLLDICIPE